MSGNLIPSILEQLNRFAGFGIDLQGNVLSKDF